MPMALAADAESDALDLTSAAPEVAPATAAPTRIFAEVAWGGASQRFEPGSRNTRRLTFDLYHASRLTPNWRVVLSNRFDHVPTDAPDQQDAVNSLREVFVGWDADNGKMAVEFGRINLRQGPGYGFNPTDFFRDGAVRASTSLNPFSLRENRLGTAMLRAQRIWDGGSASLALAPKLANKPSDDPFSLSLGSTNNRNRLLLTTNLQISERINAQALVYKEPGLRAQLGASATALLGDATVAHAEWSQARERSLLDHATAAAGPVRRGNRFAGGFTFTTASKLSITAEVHSNDFAVDQATWASLSSITSRGAYLLEADRRQDLASRRAILLYATQKDLAGLRKLSLTGFVRVNTDDRSRLHWAELRYQWSKLDLAVQWQLNTGKSLSQYWLVPDRRVLQLVGTYHLE